MVSEGKLVKNKIIELALNLDPLLLQYLLKAESLKRHFFSVVGDILVFDKIKFQRFVSNKQFLPDSYTSFKNKIGLTSNDEYISSSKDVVLAWPYKDCVLEGGQDREDAKRDEIFWNETLAPDQIDRLLSPKALVNFKKIDSNGEHAVQAIDESDNLLIKGNNLLALCTLKKTHKGRVKLIYIDPPYNTGGDSFQYNDNFNESTWLTFMKNRIEAAKPLLKNNGVIFVQCDDNEQAPLKIMLDEIFGKANFVETFIWKNTDNAPALSKKSRKNIEFIHCYENNYDSSSLYVGRESDNDDAPLLNSGNPITILEFEPEIIKIKLPDGIYQAGQRDKIELLDDLNVKNGLNANKVRLKGRFKWQQSFLNNEILSGTYFLIKSDKFSIRYQRKNSSIMAPDKLLDDVYLSKAIGVETNEDSKKHIDSLNLNFSSFPKPESLISFLIKSVTNEDDLVLDFHLGSGTTASAAHKMKRRYIGIEQMDYIQPVAVERLKKVISGEQGGISKSVNWQGGGSFVYCELAKANQTFVDCIQDAKTNEELIEIWYTLQSKAFLSYRVNPAEFDASKHEFEELSIEDQKTFLIEVLDKNLLYVPLSEIDDETYAISDADKQLNRRFFGLESL